MVVAKMGGRDLECETHYVGCNQSSCAQRLLGELEDLLGGYFRFFV